MIPFEILAASRFRVEPVLRWFWTFAEGEISGLVSDHQRRVAAAQFAPIERNQPSRYTHRDEQGTLVVHGTVDVGYRCGKIHVGHPHGSYRQGGYEPQGNIDSVKPERLVRRGLAACDQWARLLLQLAFGARPDLGLMELGRLRGSPLLQRFGELYQVVPLAPAAGKEHSKAKSRKDVVGFVERLADKAARGTADMRVVQALVDSAELQVGLAAHEFESTEAGTLAVTAFRATRGRKDAA